VLLLGGTESERLEKRRILARSMQTFRPQKREGEIVAQSRPTMRAYRWAANLSLILNNPLGVGWGQYQRSLQKYYGDLPYPEGTTDDPALYDLNANEPLTFSWLFVMACEIGLPGLAALALFLVELLLRATGRNGNSVLSGGICGAVIGLAIAAVFTSPLVRGAGPLLGVLLALSALPENIEERSQA